MGGSKAGERKEEKKREIIKRDLERCQDREISLERFPRPRKVL